MRISKSALYMSAAWMGALTFMHAGPIAAQNAATAAGASPDQATGLEEIVVTAEKREEKLQKVPISLEVLGDTALQQQHITELGTIFHDIPNLSFSYDNVNRGTILFNIRGVSQNLNDLSYDSVIGLSLDGVFFGRPAGLTVQFPDIDRIEVLRGPQGTLYGRNTTGGAINIITRRADLSGYYGELTAEVGNYDEYKFTGILNVPISDTFAIKVTGLKNNRDGWIKNTGGGPDFDGLDDQAFKFDAKWQPVDNFTLQYSYDWEAGYGTGDFSQSLTAAGNPALYGAGGRRIYAIGSPDRLMTDGYPTYAEPNNDHNHGHNLTMEWDVLDNLTVKSITGYRDTYSYGYSEFTGGTTPDAPYGYPIVLAPSSVNAAQPLPPTWPKGFDYLTGHNQLQQHQVSEEVDFLGDVKDDWLLPGKIKYTAGLFYFQEAAFQYNEGNLFLPGTEIAALIPTPTPGVPLGHGTTDIPVAYVSRSAINNDSKAAFAQLTYTPPILDDSLHLTVGGRYTLDGRSTYCVCQISNEAPAVPFTGSATKGYHNFSPAVQLTDDLTENINLYAKYSEAYRAGAFNARALGPTSIKLPAEVVLGKLAPAITVPGFDSPTNEELAKSYEIGEKAEFFDSRLRVNTALFYETIDAPQIAITVPQFNSTVFSSGGSFTAVANTGQETVQGFEASVQGEVLPGLVLGVDSGYSYRSYSGLKDYGGDPIIPFGTTGQQKQISVIFSVDYTINTATTLGSDFGKLNFHANYNWEGKRSEYNGFTEFMASPFGVLNTTITLSDIPFLPNAQISIWAQNLADRKYWLDYGGIGLGNPTGTAVWGDPRFYGATLKYSFGPPQSPGAAQTSSTYTPPPVQAPAPAPRSYLVFFDFNKSDLTPQAVEIVDQAAKNAGLAKVTELTVTGHTDTVGSDAYNMRLSRRRAESVATELEKQGMPSSEIDIVAKGKRDLLVPTGDGVPEPQNRRVQIVYSGGPTS